jgi:two-component system CheB/CheR fusion protein
MWVKGEVMACCHSSDSSIKDTLMNNHRTRSKPTSKVIKKTTAQEADDQKAAGQERPIKETTVKDKVISQRFPIVGIGASAGGLEALEQFFRLMPASSGVAFVVVPHLAPDHASLLTEILQRSTEMSVQEAKDQAPVEPNCIYIIPPNRDMKISHGILQVSVPAEPHAQRLPIDMFLRSLAEDQAEHAIGVILSGTGYDGTQGFRAINDVGGTTIAQEPATAKFDGMPTSAINAGHADHVLTVENMVGLILSDKPSHGVKIKKTKTPSSLNSITQILEQLRIATGLDFSLYKKSTIGRRIERRMVKNNIEEIDLYSRYLKENPAETTVLFKELLINVTNFFRDPEAFEVMEKVILPKLCKHKPDDYVFRVWVPACASGEEAYSIAILLCELMEKTKQKFQVQIYSTDLDDDAIATARAAIYPNSISLDVSPERLRNYFVKHDAGYRIKKEVREMVVFAIQNIIKDPPFTKLDLISCRNVMIYMESSLQNRLIPMFHYALKPDGVLFLSPSESIGNHTELFSPIDRKWKFYHAINNKTSIQPMMDSPFIWADKKIHQVTEDTVTKTKATNFAELSRKLLIQYFAPASIITNLKGDILFIHGETGRYLRPAPGHASLNIIEMAREGLEVELRNAINAMAKGSPIVKAEIQYKFNEEPATVSLCVRQLPVFDDNEELLLVSFQDIEVIASKAKRKVAAKPADIARIEDLEHELSYTKENLYATIEEQQAANEELKSTNEELQSTNEELQSVNEELETSKEELQSVNEELITVNSELQAKIEHLATAQNDMKNLHDNINIATIFLDTSMLIRRFTRDASKIYRLVASDVGRLLADIKSDLIDEDILTQAEHVLETLIPIEREVCTNKDDWYLLRIQPYRTLDNVIDGVVMTFTDITSRIKAEDLVKEARELAESIVNTIREPILVLNNKLKIISTNSAFCKLFHVTIKDTVGHKIYHLGNHQWDIPVLRKLLETILPQEQVLNDYLVEHDFPRIGRRKILLNGRCIVNKSGDPSLILLAMIEVK